MDEVSIIGIDLAKRSFQLHGARADGSVVFRKKLGGSCWPFSPRSRAAWSMEACASAHYWGREIGKLGHEVRLIAPIYVKPFVKRQKNDTRDAEAICEAALRPSMRFVAVKGKEQQARAMLFRTRDLLVRQRTQTINALRGHLAEFGVVAPQGRAHVRRLASAVEDPGAALPEPVRELGTLLLDQIAELDTKIAGLEREIHIQAREDEDAARLMTIPGIVTLPRWRSRPAHRRWRALGVGATSRPGWALCRASTRPAASRGDIEDGPARSGGSWSWAPCPWFARRCGGARPRTPGWPRCWRASRGWLWRWRWPTGWRASPGH